MHCENGAQAIYQGKAKAMDFEEIRYEVADGVAVITLNRPDKMNAWTLKMDSEYRAAMEDARVRRDVRAIIVTGAGRAFCAGADMGLLAEAQQGAFDEAGEQMLASAAQRADVRADFTKPYTFPPAIDKPIIAAINGHAMGLGLVHALFCDIRIAGDQAKLSVLFPRRGLIAEHGIAWILPRLIGLENALDLLLSGRAIDAHEAQRLGLVSRVVPQERLLDEARAYARMLADESSPRSMAVIKRQVWDSLLAGLAESVDTANREMLDSFKSPDFAEGLMAFLEKRPAKFPDK